MFGTRRGDLVVKYVVSMEQYFKKKNKRHLSKMEASPIWLWYQIKYHNVYRRQNCENLGKKDTWWVNNMRWYHRRSVEMLAVFEFDG